MGPHGKQSWLVIFSPVICYALGKDRDIIELLGLHLNEGYWKFIHGATIGLTIVVMCLLAWWASRKRFNIVLLEALLRAYLRVIGIKPGQDVRCILWVPDKDRWLKPATKYVPTGKASNLPRLLDNQGIVGLAFRTKDCNVAYYEPSVSDADYEEKLVKEWALNSDEASRVNKSRRAFIAIPILDKDDAVKGIIYCDARDPQVFMDLDLDSVTERASYGAILIEPLL